MIRLKRSLCLCVPGSVMMSSTRTERKGGSGIRDQEKNESARKEEREQRNNLLPTDNRPRWGRSTKEEVKEVKVVKDEKVRDTLLRNMYTQ
jgi:hypothetical protein